MEELKKNDELMNFVEEMGFGALKYIHPVQLDHRYIINLANSFDVDSCSVHGLAIKEEDVHEILGVKADGELVREASEEELATFKKKYENQNINITTLTTSLKGFKNSDMNFKEIFFLLTFASFYCPTSKYVPCEKVFKAFPSLSSPQSYNWAKFILDFLVEEIKDYQVRAKGKDESNLRKILKW